MIGNSLLTQVGVVGLAIAIILTYIKPTFTEIENRQDEITQTREELKKVTEVNLNLSQLYSTVNGISQVNRSSLSTFIPDKVDEVKVLKDISIIASMAKVLLTNLSYSDKPTPLIDPKVDGDSEKKSPLMSHTFSLNFVSSYEDFKEFLSLLEKNNYPLDVSGVTVTPNENGQLTIDLKLVTYSVK